MIEVLIFRGVLRRLNIVVVGRIKNSRVLWSKSFFGFCNKGNNFWYFSFVLIKIGRIVFVK